MRIPLTPEIREMLRKERKRTGVGPIKLLSSIQDPPQGLNQQIIASWLEGRVKSANPHFVRIVLKTWRSLPQESRTKIALTPERILALQNEVSRTNIGTTNLLKYIENPPVTSGAIYGWINGLAKTTWSDDYNLILQTWKSLPTDDSTRIKFTEKMHRDLVKAHKESGVSYLAIYDKLPYHPKGFNAKMIESWLMNLVKTVNTEQYDLVLKTWKSFKNPYLSYGNISFSRVMIDIGLSTSFINAFLSHPKKPQDLDEDLLYATLATSIPSTEPTLRAFLMSVIEEIFPPGNMIEITDDIRGRLNDEHEKTGLTPSDLLRSEDEATHMSVKMVNGWINGKIIRANRDHLEIIFRRYKEIESLPPKSS